jgi:hypothetical protein
MAKKHIKKSSTPLSIKSMQIKAMPQFYLTFLRLAVFKNTKEDVRKKEPSYTVGGM